MDFDFLRFGVEILNNLDAVWTFVLLFTRYMGLIMVVPGIGQGERGVAIRVPAGIMLALATMYSSQHAALPSDWAVVVGLLTLEFAFGFVVGLIPRLLIVGVQTGAQIASGSMGLGAANLIDPSTGGSMADIARIKGDLLTAMFLVIGGHYALIRAVSGMTGKFPPGSFQLDAVTVGMLVEKTAEIFDIAVMISAPVITALLLTQFVMGLISKAVPSLNIFVVSFPLTIGIGMVLTALALPDVVSYVSNKFVTVDETVASLIEHMITR